jgi:hypothetical protein
VSPAGCDPLSDESLDILIRLAGNSARWTEKNARYLLDKTDELQAVGRWPDRLEGEPKTWERFCWEVLGYDAGFIEELRKGVAILEAVGINPTVEEAHAAAWAATLARASTATPMLKHGGDRKSEIWDQGSDSTLNEDQGRQSTLKGKRDADYLTARIARDRPDILERMKAGEFPSVRAAALEAGIVKPTMIVTIEAAAIIRAIHQHCTPEQVAEIKQGL